MKEFTTTTTKWVKYQALKFLLESNLHDFTQACFGVLFQILLIVWMIFTWENV
jgi:hypothetical protein